MSRVLLAVALALAVLHCESARSPKAGPMEESKVNADAQTLQRIAQVDPVHADTMSRQPTTFTSQPLSFYKRFKLLKAEVRLPHRALQFRYADDGKHVVNLTAGDPQSIYKINQDEGLALDASQVAEYVKFFVANTDGGKQKVVEGAADIVWLPATNTDAALGAKKADAVAKLHPVQVSQGAEGFEAVATVLMGSQLVETTFQVRKSGRVQPLKQQVVVEGMPVPVVR
ncbi:hypothetical protein [Myxococcus sp. RHSTA-1-4]|uniref:hypothetical protein n=1 Tax=Myxococcus sp. RHSTA-1-4 TaxID=2874601 RepID=UPI001CBAE62A|nr:hypothetical protein [Myxococcus sp. RHSTA-1-4]MBZ4419506.1 hypothetical protein [Myxococcus sp. RHSTA-1-4]